MPAAFLTGSTWIGVWSRLRVWRIDVMFAETIIWQPRCDVVSDCILQMLAILFFSVILVFRQKYDGQEFNCQLSLQ